jgi:hypothetical protein
MEQTKPRQEVEPPPINRTDTTHTQPPIAQDTEQVHEDAEASQEENNDDNKATRAATGEKSMIFEHDVRIDTDVSIRFAVTADQILEELADECVIDLRAYSPLLPLMQVDLYHIPPQPKKVQDWTIMQGETRRRCRVYL